MDILVTAPWLIDNLDQVKILDASTHLPVAGRNADEEFAAARIPGAVRFDINKIADHASDLPHMIPPAAEFAAAMGALGLGNDDHIVIYDDSAILPAARVWWMLRLFGHAKVSVLNGGLNAWKVAGGTLDTSPATAPTTTSYAVAPSVGAQVITMPTIRAMMEADAAGQIADARPAARFSGESPEPRPGLRAGHIPGSSNVPLLSLVDENGLYKDADAIRAAFDAGGIDPDRPMIASCGSGVTACGLALGAALLGNEQVFVFDGSWTEWGSSDAPIETS